MGLRQVRAKAMYDALADHGVTHLCDAPIVMSTLLNATPEERRDFPQTVSFFTAAATPPEAVLAGMKQAGFEVTHLYGLTECYGPSVVNEWNDDWNALSPAEQAAKKALDMGLKEVRVLVAGPGAGRESAIRAVQAAGLTVTLIKDTTPIPHNGCRPRKRRRV